MSAERISATYLIETPLEVNRAAAVLAGEQSSGTFVEVPGETDEIRRRFGARVEKISELPRVSEPSLPVKKSREGFSGQYRRAEIVVSWAIENFGHNLPTLVSTVQGNLYELREFSGVKLVDLEFPESYVKAFTGPRFGIAGTRELSGVRGRPLIGTIIKPSIGLSPEDTAKLVGLL